MDVVHVHCCAATGRAADTRGGGVGEFDGVLRLVSFGDESEPERFSFFCLPTLLVLGADEEDGELSSVSVAFTSWSEEAPLVLLSLRSSVRESELGWVLSACLSSCCFFFFGLSAGMTE